jgi:hypothetical protein
MAFEFVDDQPLLAFRQDTADEQVERLISRALKFTQLQVSQNPTVYLRLPYSGTLYNLSTKGKTYDR